eukprot:jgi/Ulvmu1/5033/UM021_0050.1
MGRKTIPSKHGDVQSDKRRESPRSKIPPVDGARIQSQARAIQSIRRQIHDELFSIELSRLRLNSTCCPERWSPFIVNQGDLHCYFKVVGASDGKLLSVFDGVTEYCLGRWVRSKRGAVGWPPLDSCFYACPSPDAAVAVSFPRNSKLYKAPRVLLQVHVTGKAYQGPDGMFAFSAVKPVRVVSDTWVKGTVVVTRSLMDSSSY